MYNENFYKVINKICLQYNIMMEELCKNELLLLCYNNQTQYISSHRFPLNTEPSSRIMDNKFQCSVVLSKYNIPNVKHFQILIKEFNEPVFQDFSVEENLKQNKFVVIKPENSLQGNYVFLCKNMIDVNNSISKIIQAGMKAVICQYIKILNEYRVIYIDGECFLCFKKNITNKEWRHNLSLGAKPQIITDQKIITNLANIASSAGAAIGCRCACIDIIETKEKDLMILELNTGITLDYFMQRIPDGFNIAEKIYTVLIKKMFNIL